MKLIELLVQELPKHGGWPEGAEIIIQDGYGTLRYKNYLNKHSIYTDVVLPVSSDYCLAGVTREQYEAALAASQPQWNGEGLPPVGCECEFYNGNRYYARPSAPEDGQKVKIVHHEVSGAGIPCAVFVWIGDDKSVKSEAAQAGLFRSIRTEAERKRDETLCAMRNCVSNFNNTAVIHAIEQCYDAIAAGKIPGVKIEG